MCLSSYCNLLAMFSWCSWKPCMIYSEGKWRSCGSGRRGYGVGREKWKDVKLLSGWDVWEKNSICLFEQIFLKKLLKRREDYVGPQFSSVHLSYQRSLATLILNNEAVWSNPVCSQEAEGKLSLHFHFLPLLNTKLPSSRPRTHYQLWKYEDKLRTNQLL